MWRCTISLKGNINGQIRGFYYAASGDNDLDGQTLERPKIAIQAAIDEATALSPTAGNIALVSASQGGTFETGFVLTEFVQFDGLNTSLNVAQAIAVTLADGLECKIEAVSNSQASSIVFQFPGLTDAALFCGRMDVLGASSVGLNFTGTVETVFADVTSIVVSGLGATAINIESTNTIPIDIDVDTVQLIANDTTFIDHNPPASTDVSNVSVSTIEPNGATGTTGFLVQGGTLIVPKAGQVTCDTVIHVMSGAVLNIDANNMIGDIIVDPGGILKCTIRVHTGTIDPESKGRIVGIINNDLYGPVTLFDGVSFSDASTQNHGATRSADDWHIAASVFNQSFSIVAQDDEPDSLFFRSDGLKMYVAGSENGLVYEYDLGTSWDISTSVFLQSFDPSMTNIAGVFFRPNGLQMFLINVTTDELEEFALSTAWDISTASTVQTVDLTSIGGGTLPHDIYFKSDGLAFYVAEIFDEDVEQFGMTTPWDISTATLTTTFNTNAPDFSVSFKLDGTIMFVVNRSGVVQEFNLTTPWLIDTAELVSSTDLSTLDVRGMFLKTDGSKIYLVEESIGTVLEFNIGLSVSSLLIDGVAPGTGNVNTSDTMEINVLVRGVTGTEISAISAGESFVRTNTNADLLEIKADESGTSSYRCLDDQEDVRVTLQWSNISGTGALISTNAFTIDVTGNLNLDTTGNILFNTDISVDAIGQQLLITSVGGTGTPSFELANSSDVNKLVIEYDQQINNVNITGTVDTTLDTTSGSTFIHSAVDVRLDARSGDILLDATGEIITNTSLGINASPVNTLHIFEDDDLNITSGLAVEQAGTGDAAIHFILTGVQEWTVGVDNSISNGFGISTSLSLGIDPQFFIETGGNVGIGTSNPSTMFHISDLTGGPVTSRIAGEDGQFNASVSGNGQTNLQSIRTTGVVNYGFQGVPSDGTSGVNFRFGVSSGSTGDQRIQLFEPNGAVIQTEFCTSGGDSFINSQGGSVGIGTDTPVSKLHIYQNTSDILLEAGISIEQDGGGDAVLHFTRTAEQTWSVGIDANNDNQLAFSPNDGLNANDSPLIIKPTGEIGVDTRFPDARLDVTGSILADSIQSPFGGLGRRQNLFQFSEEFDNAVWAVVDSRVTKTANNALAPNGEMTADTAEWTINGRGIRQTMLGTLDSTTYTISVWGRSVSGNNEMRFDLHDGSVVSIFFDSVMRRHSVVITAGTGGDFLDISVNTTLGTFELWGWQISEGTESYPYSRTETDLCELEIGATISGSLRISGGIAKSIVAKTAAYTLTALDYTVTGDATSATFSFTLPTAVGITGRIYVLKKIDSSVNIVTVDADASETIDGALTYELTDENESITIQSDGSNWIII